MVGMQHSLYRSRSASRRGGEDEGLQRLLAGARSFAPDGIKQSASHPCNIAWCERMDIHVAMGNHTPYPHNVYFHLPTSPLS